MPTYDYLVFIGRFQPFHNGHLAVIKTALSHSQNVIIFIGSADSSRCPRNPFTFSERKKMIEKSLMQEFTPMILDRLFIEPLPDNPYNEVAWVASVQRGVAKIAETGSVYPRIGLIGHNKDSSSYYLKMFPAWSSIDVQPKEVLSATDIRNEFFYDNMIVGANVPETTYDFLDNFYGKDEHKVLKEWYDYDKNYKKIYEGLPYPVFITCVDSVVVQSGHILLVTRKNAPGRGLLALPGGHVEPEETFKNAAVRELKEETAISDDRGELPPAMLASFIDDTKTRLFDYPYRSSRARVITQAFLFELPNRKELFRVKGTDDAAKAQWYEIGSLKPEMFFEDHYAIIDTMLGGL